MGGQRSWTQQQISLMPVYTSSNFSSFCPSDVCEGAKYHALQFDQLEITVVPGVPNHLEFLREPPVHFENDFIIDPAIEIMVLDVAGNICTNLNTFSSVKILPQERHLHTGRQLLSSAG